MTLVRTGRMRCQFSAKSAGGPPHSFALDPTIQKRGNQMLTKSQAQAAGDALTEAGKAERIERLARKADRIPFYYRSSSLSRLPRWRQGELVAVARRSAHLTWLDVAIFGCMLAVGLAVWFSFEHVRPLATLGPFEVAFGATGVLFRIMRVKLRLLELLIEELAPKQSDGI
jgi:hypothetical protein